MVPNIHLRMEYKNIQPRGGWRSEENGDTYHWSLLSTSEDEFDTQITYLNNSLMKPPQKDLRSRATQPEVVFAQTTDFQYI